MRLFTASFAESVAVADVDRGAALVVRKGEVHPTIAAEGGAEQGEEGLILINRQQLSVAEGPPLGGEAERHDADFA